MSITLNQLRIKLTKFFDEIIKTGVPIKIKYKRHNIKISVENKKSKLANLKKHPKCIVGNPDDLVHIEWFKKF